MHVVPGCILKDLSNHRLIHRTGSRLAFGFRNPDFPEKSEETTWTVDVEPFARTIRGVPEGMYRTRWQVDGLTRKNHPGTPIDRKFHFALKDQEVF